MKIVVIVVCVVLGLAGLFMSACGGFFLIGGLVGNGFNGIWMIALPFVLLGAGCLWGAIAGIRSALRKYGNATEQR